MILRYAADGQHGLPCWAAFALGGAGAWALPNSGCT